MFFVHPRPRLAIFFDFLLIRGLGRVVFSIFYISLADDGDFPAFFTFRRPTTDIFRDFPYASILIFVPRVVIIFVVVEEIAGLGEALIFTDGVGTDDELGDVFGGHQPNG